MPVKSGYVAVTAALLAAAPAAALDGPGATAVIEIGVPQGMEARSTALILTGSTGWDAEAAARAARLTELHTLVVGIDTAALIAEAGGCAGAAALLAPLAARVQGEVGALARWPVLVGLGDGADLALLAAEAEPEAFKGLVTDAYSGDPGPCGMQAPETKAPVRWLDIVAPGRPSPVAALAGVKVIEPTEDRRTTFYRSYLGVAGTDSAFDIRTGDADVADLPLTLHEVAGAPATDTYAIFLSGDGGWAGFDEEVSDRLAAAGIPVAGISSLRYLWREKPPERIAADIARLDRHFRARWGRERLLLVGFSLGANTLPFVVPHLPDDLRRRLAGVGLIAPEARTGFEIVVGGWLGRETGSHEVGPAIAALAGLIDADAVTCLHGLEEPGSPCPARPLPGMRAPAFDGGHHLGHAHDRIAAELTGVTGWPAPVAGSGG